MGKKIFKIFHQVTVIATFSCIQYCYFNPFWSEVLKVEPNGGLPNYLLFLSPIQSSGSSTNTATSAPRSISFSKPQIKLIPGVSINFVPTVEGTVDSWSLSPTLPTGLDFSSTNGAISGTPDSSYLTSGYPLTTFTITATNSLGSSSSTFQLQIVASGGNLWTVMNGTNGGNTSSANAGLLYEAVCDCLYLAGSTQVNLNGEIKPASGANSAGFLTKFDLDGNRIWTRLFGTAGAVDTSVVGMAFDSSGNIFLSGSAPAGNFNGLTISAPTVGYIIKYDTNGNLLWVNSSDTNITHYGNGVSVDSSGNPHLVATIQNGTTLHGFNNSTGSGALMIIRYNGTNGSYGSFANMISGTAGTPGIEPYGIQISSSGTFYVSGVSRPSTHCGNGGIYYRPVLFRFDSNLNYLGCTGVPTGGGNHAFAFGVTIDPATTDVYISGYSQSSSLDSNPLVGTVDAYVTRFNSAGTKLWTRTLGVAGSGTVINMIGFAYGNLYLSGVTGGNLAGASQTISGSQDMFVGIYDSSGSQLSLRPQGTSGSTNNFSSTCPGCASSGLTFDSNNTLYTSSYTNGNVGGITNPASPNNSVFVVRNVK